MKFDPATGSEHPYPSHAEQWRNWHGEVAWLFNPWTAKVRDPRDIGSDPFGHLIIPPGEPVCAGDDIEGINFVGIAEAWEKVFLNSLLGHGWDSAIGGITSEPKKAEDNVAKRKYHVAVLGTVEGVAIRAVIDTVAYHAADAATQAKIRCIDDMREQGKKLVNAVVSKVSPA